MFRFEPVTDEQINAFNNDDELALLPPGSYSFTVKEAIHQTSSKGNSMLKLILQIVNKNGRKYFVTDYLVATEKMAFKLKHFCEAIGLAQQYISGGFAIDGLINRNGRLILGIQKGTLKPDGLSCYKDKNVVKDYVPLIGENEKEKKVEKIAFIDDDVPF